MLLIKYDSRHSNQPNLFYFLEFSLNLSITRQDFRCLFHQHSALGAGTVRPCYRAVRGGSSNMNVHVLHFLPL